MYHSTIYNDYGQEMGVIYKDQNKKEHIKFNIGKDLLMEGPYLFDGSESYYCKGGSHYCCSDGTVSNEPVFVYSVNSGQSPLYKSKLIKFPEKIVAINNGIFLIAGSDTNPPGLEIEFSEKQENGNWVATEHYMIEPPRFLYAVRFLKIQVPLSEVVQFLAI